LLSIISVILSALRIMKGNGIMDGRIILANSRAVSICVTTNANVDKITILISILNKIIILILRNIISINNIYIFLKN